MRQKNYLRNKKQNKNQGTELNGEKLKKFGKI